MPNVIGHGLERSIILSYLFQRIHSLLRKGQSSMYEDLLTEVIAEVLEDKEKLTSFMENILGVKLKKQIDNVIVNTQRTFLKIEGHETDSRPDLVIQFNEADMKYIIFFENKLQASEGDNQLQRYAEHLKSYKINGFKTYLVYITRYDDPKDNSEIFIKGITAEFIQCRWYKVYNWLITQRDAYIDKVIEFMEGLGLNESRRFLPHDMYAIQEMNRLQRMMDECLDGVVDDTMTKLFGRPMGWSNRNVQLRDHWRYFKVNDQGNWLTWIGCGFYITEEEYPLVCVTYEVSPNYENRKQVIKAMKEFIKNREDWDEYDLEDDTSWSGISCDKYLLEFLQEEDHIVAIQKFFVEKLEELHTIKEKYPTLNWKE
jgi:hypothetical protein